MATPTPTKTTAYSSGQSAPTTQKPAAPRGRKISEYGKQLAEKQKARREYGLREGQFRRYFAQATKSTVATGTALFINLERRLDNVIYRTGLAKTRRQARQMVSHGLVLVSGKRVNVPAYPVNEGEVITLKTYEPFEYNKDVVVPDWLSYDNKKKAATVDRLPKTSDIVTDINSQLIIEFYSR